MRPLEWSAPDRSEVDSVLLTSANGARHAVEALGTFRELPCYAVGQATAATAQAAGFREVVTGNENGAAVLRVMANAGLKRPLHLCGRDHVPIEHPGVNIIRRVVYAAEAVPKLPEKAEDALREGAIVLVHSARAASHLAMLVDQAQISRSRISILGISEAATSAAGGGWRRIEAAVDPTDDALLELAAKLCKIAQSQTRNGG